MNFFIIDLSKECFPDYVYEFYANLTTDNFGNHTSFVRDKKIMLNILIFNSIICIVEPSTLFVLTKKGPKSLDDFYALDQLWTLRDIPGLLKFCNPTIDSALDQDVVIVTMLLTGRKFDLADLILKNMVVVFKGNLAVGLPYGLLLTRIFDWYGVDLREVDRVITKEFLDGKSLAQSHLKIDNDGVLVQLEYLTPSSALETFSMPLDSKIVDMFHVISEDHKILDHSIADVYKKVKSLRELVAEKYFGWFFTWCFGSCWSHFD